MSWFISAVFFSCTHGRFHGLCAVPSFPWRELICCQSSDRCCLPRSLLLSPFPSVLSSYQQCPMNVRETSTNGCGGTCQQSKTTYTMQDIAVPAKVCSMCCCQTGWWGGRRGTKEGSPFHPHTRACALGVLSLDEPAHAGQSLSLLPHTLRSMMRSLWNGPPTMLSTVCCRTRSASAVA